MKEPYGEGVATHSGPESCVWHRKATDEALTGARAGRVSSLEKSLTFRVPTPSLEAEGNTGDAASARRRPDPAWSKTPSTRRNSSHGNRESLESAATADGRAVRAGNPKGASQR